MRTKFKTKFDTKKNSVNKMKKNKPHYLDLFIFIFISVLFFVYFYFLKATQF